MHSTSWKSKDDKNKKDDDISLSEETVMSSDLAQWARWERTRKGGRARYVWLYGVCVFGLCLGSVFGILLSIEMLTSRHPSPAIVPLVGFVLGLVGGYVFGGVTWHVFETQYLAALKDKQQQAAVDALASEVKELREQLKKRERIEPSHTETRVTELDD